MGELAKKMQEYVEHIRTLEDSGDDGFYGEVDEETGDLVIGAGPYIIRISESEQLLLSKKANAPKEDLMDIKVSEHSEKSI